MEKLEIMIKLANERNIDQVSRNAFVKCLLRAAVSQAVQAPMHLNERSQSPLLSKSHPSAVSNLYHGLLRCVMRGTSGQS